MGAWCASDTVWGNGRVTRCDFFLYIRECLTFAVCELAYWRKWSFGGGRVMGNSVFCKRAVFSIMRDFKVVWGIYWVVLSGNYNSFVFLL